MTFAAKGQLRLTRQRVLFIPDTTGTFDIRGRQGVFAQTLGEAKSEVFEDRHGPRLVSRYRAELERGAAAYRSVAPGDQYLYCPEAAGGGTLPPDDVPTLRLSPAGFARCFLQIWVQGEESPVDPEWGFNSC